DQATVCSCRSAQPLNRTCDSGNTLDRYPVTGIKLVPFENVEPCSKVLRVSEAPLPSRYRSSDVLTTDGRKVRHRATARFYHLPLCADPFHLFLDSIRCCRVQEVLEEARGQFHSSLQDKVSNGWRSCKR